MHMGPVWYCGDLRITYYFSLFILLLKLFIKIKIILSIFFLSAILSEIQEEPCTVFLSMSLSHLTTECKTMSYMDFQKAFCCKSGKKSDKKNIWKATKWKSVWYCHLHHCISKTDAPFRTGFGVHNWTNSKEQYLLWRFSTKKPWCYQESYRDRICDQKP